MILLCGVNHRTAPLELRERLAMDSARVTWSLERAKSTALWQEVVVLSTCNRTEVYVVTPAVVRPSHKGSHPGAASLEQISDDRASVTGCAGSRVPDDRLIINFSIWEDFDALRDFVYGSAHAGILKRRREWFERLSDAYVVLWWVPAAHRPTVAEAMARLEWLKRHGPSSEAFTFRHFYPAPDVSKGPVAPRLNGGS
jgi:hypothetical protein